MSPRFARPRKLQLLCLAVLFGTVAALSAVPSSATRIEQSFVTDYISVDEVAPVTSQSLASVTATCPTGLHVLGGGGSYTMTGTEQFAVLSSRASSSGTAWTVRWRTFSSSQESATFTVTAHCANTN